MATDITDNPDITLPKTTAVGNLIQAAKITEVDEIVLTGTLTTYDVTQVIMVQFVGDVTYSHELAGTSADLLSGQIIHCAGVDEIFVSGSGTIQVLLFK